MVDLMLACAVLFVVLVVWQWIEQRYRGFAEDHPELGPFRPKGGCGDGCSCSQGHCETPVPTGSTQGAASTSVAITTITASGGKKR